MSKQSSDKKFYLIFAAVVFFGLCSLALAGSVIWSQNRNQGPKASQNTSTIESEPQDQANNQDQLKKERYDKCIANSNQLYSEYVAKIPTGLSVEEHLMFTQQLAQTRDSQKADCDRQYKD